MKLWLTFLAATKKNTSCTINKILYIYRLNTGKKDLQILESNQKEYVVIITWIIENEKRLKELQDDTSGDDEALKKRRIVVLVRNC